MHGDVELAGDAALVEVQHEERTAGVVAAEDRDAGRELRVLDLGAHHDERSAFYPLERCSPVEHRRGNVGMPSLGPPYADQGLEWFEPGIRLRCLRCNCLHRADLLPA